MDRFVRGGSPEDGTGMLALLVLSTIAIGILGVYTNLSTLGIFVIGA